MHYIDRREQDLFQITYVELRSFGACILTLIILFTMIRLQKSNDQVIEVCL